MGDGARQSSSARVSDDSDDDDAPEGAAGPMYAGGIGGGRGFGVRAAAERRAVRSASSNWRHRDSRV